MEGNNSNVLFKHYLKGLQKDRVSVSFNDAASYKDSICQWKMNEIWVRSTGAMTLTKKFKYLLCRKPPTKFS